MIKQKIVLITGCSSGMGLSTAVYLAEKKYRVYASMRDLNKKDSLLSEATKAGVHIEILQLDVTDEESIKNAVGLVLKQEGQIDILVNNAGFGSGGFMEDYSMEEIRSQFETNFFGLVRVTKEVLPAMREKHSGYIVNISSIGGKIAFPVISIYNASKFAVEAVTESLRVELAPFGIKVTAIEPGSVKTNFNNALQAADMSRNPSSPYYDYMKRFEKNIEKISSQRSDPIVVAKAIHTAINSKNPKRNYLVGNGASMFWFLRSILPNRIFEKIMYNIFFSHHIR
ncbi:MAG: SDR family oxidoreductase [Ruminiclostridium sp.]|nr:SDR family oxidoreductase [Ruminiclostridium sp.]